MIVSMFRRVCFVLLVVSIFVMLSCENDPEIIYRDVIVEVPIEIPVEVPVEVPFEVPIEVLIEVPVVTYYEFDPKHPEDLPIGKTAFLTTYYSDENYTAILSEYYLRNYQELINQGFKSSYFETWEFDYEIYKLRLDKIKFSTWEEVRWMINMNFSYLYLTRESEDAYIVSHHWYNLDNSISTDKEQTIQKTIIKNLYYRN